VYPYFFNSDLKMAAVGNFRIGKTFFSFFQRADLGHHFIIMVCHMKQFFFLFLKKLGTALTRTGGNLERTLSYGKRRLHTKQASKKQKGKAVGYSLIKGKLKLQVSLVTKDIK